MIRNALVVEHDDIDRIGMVQALATDVPWVRAVRPTEIPSELPPGDAFDVVVVGLVPRSELWDALPGLAALLPLAAHLDAGRSRVIGLVGHTLNPVVELRVARAGFGEVVPAADVRTTAALRALLHGDTIGWPPTIDEAALAAAGVGPRSDPDAVLRLIRADGLDRAFDQMGTQRGLGLSRRQVLKLRKMVSNVGDLRSPASRSTGGPYRDTSLPTWREVVDFVSLARGIGSGEGGGVPRPVTHRGVKSPRRLDGMRVSIVPSPLRGNEA